MAFFLTQKVDFQVEGISPQTSQIEAPENSKNCEKTSQTQKVKKQGGKIHKLGQNLKHPPKHINHADKFLEKRPHLKSIQRKKREPPKEDKNGILKLCVQSTKRNGGGPNMSDNIGNIPMRDIRTPTAEEIKLLENISQKLPEKAVFDILCGHFAKVGAHTRDEFLRRAIKWRRGTSYRKNNSHCVICYLQRLASQPIQTDYNRIHSFFVPDHANYDQYSRTGKPSDLDGKRDLLHICKKADLKSKNGRENQTPPPPPPASSALESNPSKYLLNLRVTPDSELSDSDADRMLPHMYMQPKRDIHTQCQARSPPFLLNSGKMPEEMAAVYKKKALRGSFLKRELTPEKEKAKTDAELVKQITYPISSLGLTFTVPQHNRNLLLQNKRSDDSINEIPRQNIFKPMMPIIPPIRRNISVNMQIG